MPGDPVALVGPEDGHYVGDDPFGDVEQAPLARHLIVGDGSLDEVPRAVHLVQVHIGPSAVGRSEDEVGVEVAVGLLRGGEEVYPLVALRLERRVGVVLQAVSHTLESFIDVRVVEEDAAVLPRALGGVLEVADAPRLALNLVDADGDGDVLMGAETRCPEGIVDGDVGKADGRQPRTSRPFVTLARRQHDNYKQQGREYVPFHKTSNEK